MVLASSDERLAVRFAPYIAELHDFFAERGMPFGAPEDVFPLAERLSTRGVFHEEMSSMIRALIYREHESLTQAELLGLITLAIGGPEIDITEPRFRAPSRVILTFLVGARGPSRNGSSKAEHPAKVADSQARTVEPPAPVHPPSRPIPPRRLVEEVQVLPDRPWYERSFPESEVDTTVHPKRSLFARLRALWREPDHAVSHAADASYPEYQPIGLFQAKYRPFWAVGLGGVALGLGAGLMLRDRPPVPRAPVRASTPQGFHPWFPPIPKPQPDERFQANDAPLPPLPVSKPSPDVISADARPVPEVRSTGDTASSQGDEALEHRFFAQTRKPAEHIALTGQSHPAPDFPAPAAAARERARAAFAQPAPRASSERSRFDVTGPVQSRGLPVRRESVFLAASGVMAAHLLSAPAPAYPELAIASNVEGKVIVQAVVGVDGSVIATHVLSGPQFLQGAALSAVRRWRYRPYLVDGRATVVATNAILNFQLSY